MGLISHSSHFPLSFISGKKKSGTNPKHRRKQQRSGKAVVALRGQQKFSNSVKAQMVFTSEKNNKKKVFKKICQIVLGPYVSKLPP